jgi:phosphate transport system substrate-binding protein
MRAAETADVSARRGGARAVVVAIAAVTVAVHASNPIDDLTLGQVADIFSGKKRSWSDIGGPNRPITVLASPPGTGPYAFFRDHAIRLGDDASPDGYAPFVTFISDPDALAARVATDADAIAALGISAVRPGTKALKIAERSDREPIAPSVETAADGRYPLARPLLFYVPSSTPGDVADFLAFCRSDGGQDVARRLDFVPVPEPDVLSRLLR